jgi:hypothetical protein
MQQWAEGAQGMLICEQQLCVTVCAGRAKIPTANSRTAIRAMALAVRWRNRQNMDLLYAHSNNFVVIAVTSTARENIVDT